MALDYTGLMAARFDDVDHRYTHDDTVLYALGVGCGHSDADLPFTGGSDALALPTMAAVLGSPGFWLQHRPFGTDWKQILHADQSIELHHPLPAAGSVTGKYQIEQVADKGPGKPALVRARRELYEAQTGQKWATLRETWLMRGAGGFSGPNPSLNRFSPLPERPADSVHRINTSSRAALIYRLSGDKNPLHIDPTVANEAGFAKPILHGLCSMGSVAREIQKQCCDDQPARLNSIGQVFSAPVYPGESLEIELWTVDTGIRFRASVPERQSVVLDRGEVSLSQLSES